MPEERPEFPDLCRQNQEHGVRRQQKERKPFQAHRMDMGSLKVETLH